MSSIFVSFNEMKLNFCFDAILRVSERKEFTMATSCLKFVCLAVCWIGQEAPKIELRD